MSAAGIAGDFLLAAGGGLVVGLAAAYVLTALRKRIRNVAINTSTSLMAPLVAYLPAEAIHASGVLAVVVTGLVMGTKAPSMPNGAARLSQRSNWNTVQFLLENSVFLLIGLQVRTIIDGVQDDSLGAGRIWAGCAVILLAVLVLRPVWVFPATYLPRLIPAVRRKDPAPPWQFAAIVSWAGMRGVVTLAAVLVLPADLEHRSVLILAALVVVGGTLTLQGFTLPALVRVLRVQGPDQREDALNQASLMQLATAAGVARLQELRTDNDPPEVVAMLKRRTQERGLAAWERLGRPSAEAATPSERYAQLRLAMLEAERAKVLELRRGGEYAHEVLSDVLDRLDVEESMLDVRWMSWTLPARAAGKASPGPAGCAATWSPPGPRRCPATPSARTASGKARRRCTSGCAWRAATWGAAIPPPEPTPPGTSKRPAIPSCGASSRARTGAGATRTTCWGDGRGHCGEPQPKGKHSANSGETDARKAQSATRG